MSQLLSHILKSYDRIDKKLLLHKPWLWETKLHLALVLGIALNLLTLMYAFLFRDEIVAYVNDFGVSSVNYIPYAAGILSAIVFFYWLSRVVTFRGDVANVCISKMIYIKQFLAYFASISLITLPIGIVIFIGYFTYYLSAIAKVRVLNGVMEDAWPILIGLASTSFLLSMLVQIQKSIGWKHLAKGVSVYALLAVIAGIGLNLYLSAFVTFISALIAFIFFIVAGNFKNRYFSSIGLFLALLVQFASPFICWAFSYGLVLFFSLAHHQTPDWLIMWGAWTGGAISYTFFLSANFHISRENDHLP